MSAHRSIIITGTNPSSSSQLAGPSSLRTLASRVKFPNGNSLLHQFVLDYSKPNNSCIQSYINAALLSFPSDTPVNAGSDCIFGFNALGLAIEKRNYVMVQRLISRFPSIDINAKFFMGTYLNFAMSLLKSDNTSTPPAETVRELGKIIEFLIISGADLRSRDGASPLHAAVETDHVETVKFLIERGLDVNAVDKNGCAPLHLAAKFPKMVKFLVENGAAVNGKDPSGNTPLHYAAMLNADAVSVLIDSGAELNATNNGHYTPLHSAVTSRKLETVKALVERGASVNPCNNGESPLHLATAMSQVEVVRFLVNNGANVHSTGRSPLLNAFLSGDEEERFEMVKLLVQKGARVNLKDEYDLLKLKIKHACAIYIRSKCGEYLKKKRLKRLQLGTGTWGSLMHQQKK